MKKNQGYAVFCRLATIMLCVTVFLALPMACVQAQESVTPSHVYQSTEQLRAKLVSTGHIDMQLYKTVAPDTALRHPRHVMQKVRECHAVISKIIQDEGVEPSPLPALVSLHEIRPSDVKNGVEHLLSEVSKLDDKTLDAVPFEAEKLPGDVYNNLRRICHAIDISIEPSDIYRFVRVVRDNMDKIAAGRGYDIQVVPNDVDEKSEQEVYREAWGLLDDLRTLALNPDFAIPGGIVIPDKVQGGNINNKDVVALVNDAVSGTEAIKYALGVGEAISLPTYEEGKSLSDVFGLIYDSRQIVKQIIDFENSLADRELEQ